eukprot:TRINITY_DN11134_c0_g2_i1.p1 TRINITY_DN11134_c0_g2~~TRINITY_DN11134_c0_g2_i1.p1  ORF type:complete len:1011 (-),score=184.11 TRINITY_DN11134_c0_g2_i1:105-3137(-)
MRAFSSSSVAPLPIVPTPGSPKRKKGGSYHDGFCVSTNSDDESSSPVTRGSKRLDSFASSGRPDAQSFMKRLRARSRLLCESWRFCVLTTVLTIYALFGDDFRLSMTHKRTDVLFNVLTMFCILIFSVEILAASLGKDEYFLGFFFTLDIGSTITLIFDLTWVADLVFCSYASGAGGDGDNNTIRTSRAGRAGARASRTVRLIRLIRLVKLYKTYKLAIESGLHSGSDPNADGAVTPGGVPEEEDLLKAEDLDESETGGEDNPKKAVAETRVGRKLSEKTTRRVIVLVLVMLFATPLFTPSQYGTEEFRSSAQYGVEVVYTRWREWCNSGPKRNGSNLPWCLQLDDGVLGRPSDDESVARFWYEKYFLSFLYSHHVGDFAWQLFWIGIESASLQEHIRRGFSSVDGDSFLSNLAQLAQPRFLGSRTLPVNDWEKVFTHPGWGKWNPQPLQSQVKQKLVEPWVEQCTGFVGVSVSAEAVEAEHPSVCSIDEELRCTEVDEVMPVTRSNKDSDFTNMRFAFDTRGTTRLEAGLSMLQTIFICFAVGMGAMIFSYDANQLLLNPIERMIAKMETIKDNPLEAMKLGDIEFRREEIENARMREKLAHSSRLWIWLQQLRMKKVKEPMETVILEKTIIKLGGLLALAFGEAGAEIIGQNMKGGASAGVNAMVPGSKVDAIIGFCNIRNFADATEVLKESVMVFVNLVGEIVHGCADDYNGAPNKNIGDSFLIVWRLSSAPSERQTKLADMAIMAFIQVLIAINKSPVLEEYRKHPGLLQRLPNYRVQMGFGLHCGWAIEGAIGSEFKIDASYLSPNVNVAARLEAATTQFGVWILISHFMVNLCSPEMAAVCRLIDHVTVKGSKQPVRLHTIDLDFMQLQVQQRSMSRVIKNRFKVRQVRELRRNEKWLEDCNLWRGFGIDDDLILMRSSYFVEFFQRFSMAYRNYEAGEWLVARDMLFACHFKPVEELGTRQVSATLPEEWPRDGPTVTLLRYMQRNHFWPPLDWAGHRELTEN